MSSPFIKINVLPATICPLTLRCLWDIIGVLNKSIRFIWLFINSK